MKALIQILRGIADAKGRIAIAFSGGLDSRFLAHSALLAGLSPVLLHVKGPHIPEEEHEYAVQWAKNACVSCTVLPLNPLESEEVYQNHIRRCYYCKRTLFSTLLEHCAPLPLCDGTHASDSSGYRPGLQAIKELGILSPLAMAGLSKPEIRRLAAQTGMEYPEQKASPCLLTRLNYGQTATPELLHALDKAENTVKRVLSGLQTSKVVQNSTIAGASDYDSLKACALDSASGCDGGENAPRSMLFGLDAGLRKDTIFAEHHLPEFRIRQVLVGVFELHFSHQASPLSSVLEQHLRQTITNTSGLSITEIRYLPTLSGFFDQSRK